MLVLTLTILALMAGLALRTLDGAPVYGPGGWVYVQWGVMALLHGIAGLASWNAHYHRWSDRAFWMMAVNIHCLTYPLNWAVYRDLVVLADTETQVLKHLVMLTVVLLPSVLMLGGPLVALLTPRRQSLGV